MIKLQVPLWANATTVDALTNKSNSQSPCCKEPSNHKEYRIYFSYESRETKIAK